MFWKPLKWEINEWSNGTQKTSGLWWVGHRSKGPFHKSSLVFCTESLGMSYVHLTLHHTSLRRSGIEPAWCTVSSSSFLVAGEISFVSCSHYFTLKLIMFWYNSACVVYLHACMYIPLCIHFSLYPVCTGMYLFIRKFVLLTKYILLNFIVMCCDCFPSDF